MIFTIQDAKASASIDSLGAQLISYQDAEGQEYIWQREIPNTGQTVLPFCFLP